MVGEEEVIVRDSVADGIVGADDVDEGGEERKCVTVVRRREIRDPLVWFRVRVCHCRLQVV